MTFKEILSQQQSLITMLTENTFCFLTRDVQHVFE